MALVYVVLIHDRHFDLEAQVFSQKEDAIAFARETGHELARHPESYRESQIADWVFYANYGESDSVRVYERELR